MKNWIPLLSPMPFGQFSPESFREYVRSLKQERKVKAKGKKKPKRPSYSARVNLKGTLIITTKRKPKYLTNEELTEIGVKTGRPANEIFLYIKAKEYQIMSHEEADEIKQTLGEIPW